MKVDLHLHSKYSWDSRVEIEAYISQAEKDGFGAIAITDHNSNESHSIIEKLQPNTEVLLIPGQEVSTRDGHLLVYGWMEAIDAGLTMQETTDLAHKLGGYCIAAHPFDPFRGGSFSRIFEFGVDGIEVLNASAWFGIFNWLAKRSQRSRSGFVGVANSDAHRLVEFGSAFTIVQDSKTTDDVLANLKQVELGGGRIGMIRKTSRFIRRTIF